MIYGYARVSTKGQAKDGNSLENQEKQLMEYGATEVYKDSFTGTKMDRPQLDKLLSKLESGDTLMVTKLDRIARSMTQGIELVNELISKGIRVHILNIGIMDNTPSSKLIRNIFFAFAEFERDMIVERTQEGKEVAKTKDGFKEGRPKKYTQTQLDMAIKLLEEKSYTEVEKETRISKSTLIREVRRRKALEAKQEPVAEQDTIKDNNNNIKDTKKKSNKEIIKSEVNKLGYELSSCDSLIDKLSKKELKKVLDVLSEEYTDVDVVINKKEYVIEISTVDNEIDLNVISKTEYIDRYSDERYND